MEGLLTLLGLIGLAAVLTIGVVLWALSGNKP